MKQILRAFLFLMVALVGVASCGDEPDGKWDKMKWTNVNNLMNVNGIYLFPEESGTYTFLCRNYDSPWIESVVVNGVSQTVVNENRFQFNGEWFTLNFEGNKLTITVKELPQSVESRGFELNVTAGDVFDTLIFSQKMNVY